MVECWCWHLVDRGQGFSYTSYNAQHSPTTKTYLAQHIHRLRLRLSLLSLQHPTARLLTRSASHHHSCQTFQTPQPDDRENILRGSSETSVTSSLQLQNKNTSALILFCFTLASTILKTSFFPFLPKVSRSPKRGYAFFSLKDLEAGTARQQIALP